MADDKFPRDPAPPTTPPVVPDWRTRITEQRGIDPGQDSQSRVLHERGLKEPLPSWQARLEHERQNAKPDQGPGRSRWLPQEQNPDLAKQYARPAPPQSPPRDPSRGRER